MANTLQPNQYQLEGTGLKITYSSSSFDGKPRMSFRKGNKTQEFVGDQITATNTGIGSLVTVAIAKTVDRGFTTFSILIPEILLAKIGAKQAFRTIGLQTEHKTTIAGPVKGAIETYKVLPLQGSATHVLFAQAQTAGS